MSDTDKTLLIHIKQILEGSGAADASKEIERLIYLQNVQKQTSKDQGKQGTDTGNALTQAAAKAQFGWSQAGAAMQGSWSGMLGLIRSLFNPISAIAAVIGGLTAIILKSHRDIQKSNEEMLKNGITHAENLKKALESIADAKLDRLTGELAKLNKSLQDSVGYFKTLNASANAIDDANLEAQLAAIDIRQDLSPAQKDAARLEARRATQVSKEKREVDAMGRERYRIGTTKKQLEDKRAEIVGRGNGRFYETDEGKAAVAAIDSQLSDLGEQSFQLGERERVQRAQQFSSANVYQSQRIGTMQARQTEEEAAAAKSRMGNFEAALDNSPVFSTNAAARSAMIEAAKAEAAGGDTIRILNNLAATLQALPGVLNKIDLASLAKAIDAVDGKVTDMRLNTRNNRP